MANRISIRVITLGVMPLDLDLDMVRALSSTVYEIDGNIDTYDISSKADGKSWEYTDGNLQSQIPKLKGS